MRSASHGPFPETTHCQTAATSSSSSTITTRLTWFSNSAVRLVIPPPANGSMSNFGFGCLRIIHSLKVGTNHVFPPRIAKRAPLGNCCYVYQLCSVKIIELLEEHSLPGCGHLKYPFDRIIYWRSLKMFIELILEASEQYNLFIDIFLQEVGGSRPMLCKLPGII